MHTREINHVGEEVASGASSKGGQAIPRQREHKKITWEQQKNQHWLRLCDGARSLVHSRYGRNVAWRGRESGESMASEKPERAAGASLPRTGRATIRIFILYPKNHRKPLNSCSWSNEVVRFVCPTHRSSFTVEPRWVGEINFQACRWEVTTGLR